MKQHIDRRLVNPRGRQTLYRNRHLHARKLGLDDAEYRLLDLYGALSGWDRRYPSQFESVHATDKEIADILGCDSTTVCKTRNKLIAKNLVRKDCAGDYKILRIFNKEEPIDGVHTKLADIQQEIASKNTETANKQVIRGYDSTPTISSSNEIYVPMKTKEEYEEIVKKEDKLSNEIYELNDWNSDDPKLKEMVKEQQRLAGMMLEYEIENDLIPELL